MDLYVYFKWVQCFVGFPHSSVTEESACSVGDLGSIPGLGRSPGEGKGYPLQYSGLENSMDYIQSVNVKSLSCVRLFATLWTIRFMESLGQNSGVGSLSLLQGIFPTQG